MENVEPYRAQCTTEDCAWEDKVLFQLDDAKSQAANHHRETSHITIVTDFEGDEVVHEFGK